MNKALLGGIAVLALMVAPAWGGATLNAAKQPGDVQWYFEEDLGHGEPAPARH